MARKPIEIADALERAILCGEFAAGELINEPELATKFGVSRTPVREALLNLSAAGLVELKRGTGAIVVGVSLDTIFEAYEVLANALGFACALAAERMTPFQRAALQDIVAEMRRNVSKDARERYIVLDEQLHEAILEGAKNAMLARQVRECKRRIAAVRQLSMRSHESVEHIVPELERVVAAIADGDPKAARAALEEHINLRGSGAQRLVAHWRKLTESEA
ncbi:GntR family transcriptional regulator [Acidocella sp. KAb 2-4]|uniref:GntR family transcriptional regulator n=1 Tax=Acidocella sp. KAb 2-4 TaxID=2885158 RepID=UPI001D069EBB|nr:GntR family transcriptional regulator [Acidocella sp. KAb 2-4]MCB5945518.1 GntR family transcriptional regulator [Acidocella sp. KAb 2-4]